MTELACAPRKHFLLFLGGASLSSFALGVNTLLYPWLLVGILGVHPDHTGFAMMVLMIPSTFLLLWGGALSQGRPLGSFLLRLNFLYALPLLFLLVCAYQFGFSYPAILFFGLFIGVINAFVQPARESLLGEVAISPLQGSVARTMVAQYVGMGLGTLVAGNLLRLSLTAVIFVELVAFLLCGLLLYLSSPPQSTCYKAEKKSIGQISEGLRMVWSTPVLRNLMAMTSVTGLLGLGYYFVMLPLLVREVYFGEAHFLAGLQATFLLGGVICSLLVIRYVPVFERPGKVLILATFLRGAVLLLVAFKLSTPLLFCAVFCWGVLSGLSTMVGRTLAQQLSPEGYRSRVISIYQLFIFGVGPWGALLGGILIDSFGVLMTTAILGSVTSMIGVGCLISRNKLWQLNTRLLTASRES